MTMDAADMSKSEAQALVNKYEAWLLANPEIENIVRHNRLVQDVWTGIAEACKERDLMLMKARVTLRRHAIHTYGCDALSHTEDNKPCSCGLQEMLKELFVI